MLQRILLYYYSLALDILSKFTQFMVIGCVSMENLIMSKKRRLQRVRTWW